MTLQDLLEKSPAAIEYDSRQVKPGAVFVALRGVHADGARFVPQAIANGAVAVVAESAAPQGGAVPWVQVPSARAALAELAAGFYGNPSEQLAPAHQVPDRSDASIACGLPRVCSRT